MNEQNKHIDDIFREALGNYAETPPAGVWNDIEQRLPDGPKRPRGFGGWMWGVVLLLLVGGGLLVARKFSHNEGTSNKKQIAETNTATSNTENNSTITNGAATTTNQPSTTNNTPTTAASGSGQGTQAAPTNARPATTSASGTHAAGLATANTTAGSASPVNSGSNSTANAAVHSGSAHSNSRRGRTHMHRRTSNNNAATTAPASTAAANNTTQPQKTPSGNRGRRRIAKNTTAHSTNKQAPKTTTNPSGPATASATPHSAKKSRHRSRNTASGTTAVNPATATSLKPSSKATGVAGNTGNSSEETTTTPVKRKHKVVQTGSSNTNPVTIQAATFTNRRKNSGNMADKANSNSITATDTPVKKRKSKTAQAETSNATPVKPPVAATFTNRHRKARNTADNTTGNNTAAADVTPAKRKKHQQPAEPAFTPRNAPTITVGSVKTKHKKVSAAVIPPATTTTPAVTAARFKKKHPHKNPSPSIAGNPKPLSAPKPAIPKPRRQATPAAPAIAKGKSKKVKQQPPATTIPAPAASSPVVAKPTPATQPAAPTIFPKQSKPADPYDKPFLKQPTLTDNGSDNSTGGNGSGGSGGGGGSDKPEKIRKPININLDAGIFAGYEKGFGSFNVDKTLFGAYLHYHFSTKLGLMVPLSYKFGNFNSNQLASSGNYYQIQSADFSSVRHFADSQGTTTPDTALYAYAQTYDSVHVNLTATKKLWQVDIPLLLTFQLAPNLSVFAGPVLSFGNQIKLSNSILHNIVQFSTNATDTLAQGSPMLDSAQFAALAAPGHSGQLFSTYDSTTVQNATTNPLRLGYMLGLQFTTGNFNFNLSVQQSLSGTSQILNPDIKKAYTQPYFRATIGYRILKGRQRKTQAQMEQEREDEYHRIQ